MSELPEIRKVAGFVPVTAATLADMGAARSFIDEAFDRWANPWKYPDSDPMPAFDLFPILTRMRSWLRRLERTNPCPDAD